MPSNRNGVIVGCWREFIDSPSTGCALKFNRYHRRITIVSFLRGNAQGLKI
jgi:hypothetical protein